MHTKSGEPLHFDPICGKRVEPEGSHAVAYRRRTYFFCSESCKKRFEHQAARQRLKSLARMGTLFSKHKVRWGLA
jgi:YHS domain-containing protein